jgi:hypothetical protein
MEIKDTLCLRIDKELLDNIKQIARELSVKEQKDISYSDLIRKSLEDSYGK